MSKYKNLISISKLIFNDHVTVLYDINSIYNDRKQREQKLHMLTLFENEIFPYMTEQEKESLNIKIDSQDQNRINTFLNELELLTLMRAAKQQL